MLSGKCFSFANKGELIASVSSCLWASPRQKWNRLGRKWFRALDAGQVSHLPVIFLRRGQFSSPATGWTRKRMGSRRGHRDRFAATASPAPGHEPTLPKKVGANAQPGITAENFCFSVSCFATVPPAAARGVRHVLNRSTSVLPGRGGNEPVFLLQLSWGSSFHFPKT